MSQASLVHEANYIGPKDGLIRVEAIAAATSEVIDLEDATRGNILGGYITLVCDQPLGFRFSEVNTGTAELAATDVSTPANRVGLIPANTPTRFRVPGARAPGYTRYLVVVTTLASTLRMWKSSEV